MTWYFSKQKNGRTEHIQSKKGCNMGWQARTQERNRYLGTKCMVKSKQEQMKGKCRGFAWLRTRLGITKNTTTWIC